MMLMKFLPFVILVSLIPLTSYTYAGLVGSASIHAPAVILENNSATLTLINLTVTNGRGSVSVLGPESIGNSTVQSAYTAAQYGASYLNLNFTKYNFTYTIEANTSNVTGPSAGAAMTLLAISALEHKKLRNDFAITGTISSDGSVGEIGGVYNKVQAAHQSGIDLVLVPSVPATSSEAELYYLVQTEFGVPLVQVPDISRAAFFAFNSSASGVPYESGYNFYTNYSVKQLPESTLTCSDSCNESIFKALVNYTLNLTGSTTSSLGTDSRFYGVSQQLDKVLNQSYQIAGLGYLYVSADFGFLEYINSFIFYSHDTTMDSALSTLEGVQARCSSLMQPQITSDNYDYILGAELRQAWGNYTINSTISTYNQTAIDTDSILDDLRYGAEANGWCGAAEFVFNDPAVLTGNPINFSASLAGTAMQRIVRAEKYGSNMYLATAQQAYRGKNYPLAILDADYAFAIYGISSSGLSVPQMLNASKPMALNSTYGAWATEFAKESQFYAYEAGATSNTTLANTYSLQAYTSALLASQLSSDTKLIYDSSVQVSSTASQNAAYLAQNAYLAEALSRFSAFEALTIILLALIVVVLVANLVLIVLLIKKSTAKSAKAASEKVTVSRRRRTARRRGR
jgi:hypothetical protein